MWSHNRPEIENLLKMKTNIWCILLNQDTIYFHSEVKMTVPILLETFIPVILQRVAHDYIVPDDNRR